MGIRDDLQSALVPAMRAKDRVMVAAVRSALATLGNAEAVPVPVPPTGSAPESPLAEGLVGGHGTIAGSAVGLGAAETARLELSEDEQRTLVQREVDERVAAAATLAEAGQGETVERLHAEAAALTALLHP